MSTPDENAIIAEFLASYSEKQKSINFHADDLRERRALAFASCKENDTGTPTPVNMRHLATLLDGATSLVVRTVIPCSRFTLLTVRPFL